MPGELSLHDKMHLHLFEGKSTSEVYLTDDELNVKKRVEAIFTKLLDDPTIPEYKLRNLDKEQFGVSIATAYRDVSLTKSIFGNFNKASREYYRYKVLSYLDWAIETAKNDGDVENVVKAADKMGKYTKLDQPEIEDIPWEELMPPSFEPTNDIEVLGIKRDPELERKKRLLVKKYFEPEDAKLVE